MACKRCGGPTVGLRKFCDGCRGSPRVGVCSRCGGATEPRFGRPLTICEVCRNAPDTSTCVVCGEVFEGYRLKLCPQHARQKAGTRLCRCGKPALPKRMTCSDECAGKFHGVPLDSERTESICVVCGKAFPSTALSRTRTCSPECAKQNASWKDTAPRKCVVCGADCPRGRRTCSEACRLKCLENTSAVGIRSEQVRAKRRRHAKSAYRKKDKAEVIARLTAEQDGKCAVCGSLGSALGDGSTGLVLDHDHNTGEPRAMLCTSCNAALGLMRERPELVMCLARYAERWCATRVCREPNRDVSESPPVEHANSASTTCMHAGPAEHTLEKQVIITGGYG